MADKSIEEIIAEFSKEFPTVSKELITKFTDLNVKLGKTGAGLIGAVDKLCRSLIYARENFDKLSIATKFSSKTIGTHSATIIASTKSVTTSTKATNTHAAATEAGAKTIASSSTVLGSVMGTLALGMTQAFTSVITGAMSGKDAITLATDAMKGQIKVLGNTVAAGATAISSMGNTLAMSSRPHIAKFGRIAGIAGSALSVLSSAATELASAGLDFMRQQTEKMLDGFRTMTAAGAIYTDGMMGMVSIANTAGMTLEKFSKAVSESKNDLIKLGLGVSQGSKKLASAMSFGGESVRRGMFELGMSMEDQAAAYATVMANMAGPSGKLNASNKEISETTEKYAANLKLLSNLTGEDMKAKREKLRQENDILRFQQELDKMGEDERNDTIASMEGMSELHQRAFREEKMYKQIRSADINIALSRNAAERKVHNTIMDLSKKHELKVRSTLKAVVDNQEESHKITMKDEALSLGASAGNNPNVKAAAELALKNDQYIRNITKENFEKEVAAIEKRQKDGKNKGKDTEASGLSETLRSVETGMQEVAAKHLPAFSQAIQDTVKSIKKAVEAMADVSSGGGISIGALMGANIISSLVGTLILPLILNKFGGKIMEKIAGSAIMQKMASKFPKTAGVLSAILASGSDAVGVPGGPPGPTPIVPPGAPTIPSTTAAGVSSLGKSISSVGRGAGSAINSILTGLARGLTKLGSPKVLLGSAALIGIGASLWVSAKGLREFAAVDLASLGKAALTLGGLVAATLVIGKVGPQVLAGAGALMVLSGSLLAVGMALNSFNTVEWESLGKGAVALVGLTAAVFGLGALLASGVGAVVFAAGVAGLVGLGVAVGALGVAAMAAGKGIEMIGSGVESISDSITKIRDTDKLSKLGDALLDFYNKTPFVKLATASLSLPKIGSGIGSLAIGLTALPKVDNKLSDIGTGLLDFYNKTPFVKLATASLSLPKIGSGIGSLAIGLANLPKTGTKLSDISSGLLDFYNKTPFVKLAAVSPLTAIIGAGLYNLTRSLTYLPSDLSSLFTLGSSLAEFYDKTPFMKLASVSPLIAIFGAAMSPLSHALNKIGNNSDAFAKFTTSLTEFQNLDASKIMTVAEAINKIEVPTSSANMIGDATKSMRPIEKESVSKQFSAGNDNTRRQAAVEEFEQSKKEKEKDPMLLTLRDMRDTMNKVFELQVESNEFLAQLLDVSETHKGISNKIARRV